MSMSLPFYHSFLIHLFISKDCVTFTAVKQNVLTYRQKQKEQKGANFSASFNADCLVGSEKMTTLHTFPSLILAFSYAREIWHNYSLQRDFHRFSLQIFCVLLQ